MDKKEKRLTISWEWLRDMLCNEPYTLSNGVTLCGHSDEDKSCCQRNCVEWKALKEENRENVKKQGRLW